MSIARAGLGVALIVMFLLALVPAAAHAVEGGGVEVPDFSELRESSSDTAQQFLPEDYERPGFFDWWVIPLIAVGVLASLYVLVRYLVYQPKFAREAEEREKSRR